MGKRRQQATHFDQADELIRKITGKTVVDHAKDVWDTYVEPELRRILRGKSLADPRYAVLEVREGCSNRMLKAAFREKAKETHPDTGGSDEAFKRVHEAYLSICRERGIEP